LPGINTLPYVVINNEDIFYEYDSGCIHNTSFSSCLTNVPNMLECYTTLGRKGLSGTNTLVYLVHSLVANVLNKLESYITLDWEGLLKLAKAHGSVS